MLTGLVTIQTGYHKAQRLCRSLAWPVDMFFGTQTGFYVGERRSSFLGRYIY